MISLPSLAGYAAPRARVDPAQRCELCAAPIREPHRHVVELGVRGVCCACRACALLFEGSAADARYRSVPDRVIIDRDFALPADRLGIPVGLACIVRDPAHDRVLACYPGPAGIVDGELTAEAWTALAAATQLADRLEPDVEALLVHSERGSARSTCYLVPITAMYELAGRLRRTWHGFHGGDEAERELAAFFADLDRVSAPLRAAARPGEAGAFDRKGRSA